eukprot:1157298-Pelagomonas_calceolata.AAC.24
MTSSNVKPASYAMAPSASTNCKCRRACKDTLHTRGCDRDRNVKPGSTRANAGGHAKDTLHTRGCDRDKDVKPGSNRANVTHLCKK